MAYCLSFEFVPRAARGASMLAVCALLAACASKDLAGYGVGPQAERAAMAQRANQDPKPDTPGVYLGLIDQMQAQGLYFASLAHIDAYEKQYGVSPDTNLLRADALRMTDQPAAAADAYALLLKTPLAARGYRGLGLIAGAAGDFARAAQQLEQAARLEPTDAAILSDLGYARLREGDVNGARVPLMKAGELDQNNPKIVSNVVLYLLANGEQSQALAVMNQQKLTPEVRTAIRSDAAKIAAAGRARTRAQPASAQQQFGQTGAAGTVASVQGIEPAPRVLQRFAQ
ncbi:tetratricopeptide repeat protein [Paraburkholderia bryophila]|uniref:Flp pilus assembly protein TadD n=1 Tax=Paraburkholderia bryophila TaxID=420952 RepID=A0A7Z0B694_9BURK|nr:tetratricopeptide repeat protein [Paraburkholderia bryophila]NYH21530.1 Flp pilus assembly protein TadD [Paraburkholderia bryophila]